MSSELKDYMYRKLRILREFQLSKTKLEEAQAKLSACTNEIQMDNITKTILMNN